MLNNLGIVEACFATDASRMRAARRLGGKSVLEWIVRRATDALRLDAVVVVTNERPENRFVADLVPLDVPVFFGAQPDVLGCLAAALEAYRSRGAVRISGRSLFVDPLLVDRLVAAADARPECDYVAYCCRDGRPAIQSPVAIFGEWFRTTTLHAAARRAATRIDRQSPTRYIYSRPKKFNVLLLPAPAQVDREDLRLTTDLEEDWENVVTLFDALGPDALDWQRTADLLDHQPDLRRRMAALNRVAAHG
jgi:spore coat polysaccharide biosynthesis protein SpsF